MAAFDITTRPTSLSLKPGSAGSILVVVSNRLGRPVMGSVEGVMTPAYASSWLLEPPDLLSRYEADPAATHNYEFKVSVPENARAGPVQFTATVRDTLNPDDNRADGQSVAIDVTSGGASPIAKKKKLPAWVWLIAGVMVVGTGLMIWLTTRPDKVPEVIGMIEDEARDALTEVGFDTVVVRDTFSGADEIEVVRQEPEAGSSVRRKKGENATTATIVVNRPVTVPNVIGKTQSEASATLVQAGFGLVDILDTVISHVTEGINTVVRQEPEAGTAAPRGEMAGKSRATIVVKREATVPNVVGKDADDARKMLRQAGFAPVNVTELLVQKAGADTDIVVHQQPRAGSPLPRDTMVGETPATIEVKWGATEVPKVVGLPEAHAKERLQSVGLQIGTITRVRHVVMPRGVILDMAPAAGKVVRLGSSVKLVISN